MFFWGRRCADEWVKPWKTSWQALWSIVIHPWRLLHPTLIHFLLFRKNLDQMLQDRTFNIINLLDLRCLCRFFKSSPILANVFVMAPVVDTNVIFVDCGINLTMSANSSSLIFFYVNLVCTIAIHKGPM